MNFSSLPKPIDDGLSDHLLNMKLPEISLPNQDGRILSLNRRDTFRLVLYFYPMTGNPNKPLPKNWDNIPGARGCTPETCSFRDNYDELIKLNSIPIGITSQKIDHNKEMTERLRIPFDILSDSSFELTKLIKLPTFAIDEKIFIKRLTIILEKSVIKKVFYPIFPPDLHINDVLEWLKKNQ